MLAANEHGHIKLIDEPPADQKALRAPALDAKARALIQTNRPAIVRHDGQFQAMQASHAPPPSAQQPFANTLPLASASTPTTNSAVARSGGTRHRQLHIPGQIAADLSHDHDRIPEPRHRTESGSIAPDRPDREPRRYVRHVDIACSARELRASSGAVATTMHGLCIIAR